MKQTIGLFVRLCDFEDAFRRIRPGDFSYSGLQALFEYLEQYEEDTGEVIELDVIALCCDYTEYKNLDEYINEHEPDISRDDYEDEDDYYEAVKEEIGYNTTLIEIEGEEGFIIQNY